jgi:hypothetical protein
VEQSVKNQENQPGVSKFRDFEGGLKIKWKQRRTVNDPTFDFGRRHLQYGGYVCVRQVLPDVLEAEICEG